MENLQPVNKLIHFYFDLIRSSVLRRMRRLPAMQAAIQGGPFLVENGSAVKDVYKRQVPIISC